jgi:ABC-2 type transport system permease protein
MSELTGTGVLVRAAVRRDRIRMAVWMVAIVAVVVSSAQSVKSFFGSPEQLAQIAKISEKNVAAIVFNGPPVALDTLGGQVAFQVGTFGLVAMALMSVFTLGRLTRSEEENGRTELLLATVLGRHAPLTAALIVTTALSMLTGALVAAGVAAMDLPVAGAVALGVSFTAIGFVFAGFAAVAAQITENTRVVYGSCAALVGLSFVLRAIGDIGDGTVSWFSPIGWSQKLRPWAGEAWWTLIVPALATVLLVGAAWALAAHRDVGAGLIAPRPGRPAATPTLGRPLGMALRLQRGSLIGWCVGVALMGISYGSVANQINDFATDNQQMRDYLTGGRAGDPTLLFLSTTVLTTAMLAAGFAVQATLRLHSEEAALRAEPLLATPVSRVSWAGTHLIVAAVGSGLALLLANVGAGVTYGLIVHDFSTVPRLAAATVAYLPAMWVMIGVAVALYGLVPRAALAAWGAFAAVVLVGFLADLLRLPGWLRDLSPFEHVARVPAADVQLVPLAVLAAIAGVLTAAGLYGFRQRDTPA